MQSHSCIFLFDKIFSTTSSFGLSVCDDITWLQMWRSMHFPDENSTVHGWYLLVPNISLRAEKAMSCVWRGKHGLCCRLHTNQLISGTPHTTLQNNLLWLTLFSASIWDCISNVVSFHFDSKRNNSLNCHICLLSSLTLYVLPQNFRGEGKERQYRQTCKYCPLPIAYTAEKGGNRVYILDGKSFWHNSSRSLSWAVVFIATNTFQTNPLRLHSVGNSRVNCPCPGTEEMIRVAILISPCKKYTYRLSMVYQRESQ